MLIIFNEGFQDIDKFISYFESLGLSITRSDLDGQTVLKLKGNTYVVDEQYLNSFEGINKIIRLDKTFDLVRLKDKYCNVKVGNVSIGHDSKFCLIGGPCSITSYDDLKNTVNDMKNVDIIRGGAYKLRKSPYAFQGLKEDGLMILNKVGQESNKPVISEITKIEDIPLFVKYVDVIQVGARNMNNYPMLKALGKVDKPILLKRGISSTVEEWLLAAEYIVYNGNKNVILCERGIRTFENSTRNTLDLSAVSLVKKLSNLPVIVDPSHATGRYDLIEDMVLASVACGADGIILEVSSHIEGLKSDGAQTISTKRYNNMLEKVKRVCEALDRDF